MDIKVGFIGAGKMAQALGLGFVHAGLIEPKQVTFSDRYQEMLKTAKDVVGDVHIAGSNVEVVSNSDVVIVAVKPDCMVNALKDISSVVTSKHLIISIAAGWKLSQLQELLPADTKVVRLMPNTAATVECSACIYCCGPSVQPHDSEIVQKLFSSIGYCVHLEEKYHDAATGISGCGTAFMFLVIEALADGGVKMGLARDVAQRLAAQTVMGTGKMVLELGKHPGELKDMVCSPGGATICGVHMLEKNGVRSAFIDAVEASAKQSAALGAVSPAKPQ